MVIFARFFVTMEGENKSKHNDEGSYCANDNELAFVNTLREHLLIQHVVFQLDIEVVIHLIP